MILTHNLGFPRIGARRELKQALESFWRQDIDAQQLQDRAKAIREENWLLQKRIGIDLVPVGDFSLYDHMLNMTTLLGAIPARFDLGQQATPLDAYFAMARGTPNQPAMEMTKWFNTNYHYIVPEFDRQTQFTVASTQLFDEIAEAQALGISPQSGIGWAVVLFVLRQRN